MTAEKVRIYDLAKKLKLSNKEVMDLLEQKCNISVKSHSSTIEQKDADKLEASITSKSSAAPAKAEPVKNTAPPKAPAPIHNTDAPVQKPEEKKSGNQENIIQEPKKEFKSPEKPNSEPNRPYGDRPSGPPAGNRPYGDRPPMGNRPYGDRPSGPPAGNRPYGDRPPMGNRPYGDRPSGPPTGNRPYGDRPPMGNRPYGDRPSGPPTGNRPYGDRPPMGNRPYGDRPSGPPSDNRLQGDRPPMGNRPYGDRPSGPPAGNRPYGDRPPMGNRPYGDRPSGPPTGNRPYGDRPPMGNRPYGDRPSGPPTGNRPYGDRPPRPPMGNRPMGPRPSSPPEKPESIGKEEPDRLKSVNRKDFVKKKDKLKEIEELRREKQAEQKIQAKLLKKKKEEQELAEKVTEIHLMKQLTVGELAERLHLSVAEVIKQLMMSGIMATVNQTIDIATAKQTAEALGFSVIEKHKEVEEETPEEETIDKSKLKDRAPVVTIMGHVDHGKTTLLDSIRNLRHKLVSAEVGGITQTIGAYTAMVNNKKIVFIDTPGHEAFTTMRARGAQITDIVILVVAADDGLMPQTIEAINHAKAAKVPIIVAVNKIDKAGADPDRVLQQLTEYQLIPEKWGGSTIAVEISALQGLNIDELLDYILLVAEVEELKADPTRKASGVIIESRLDKSKGTVATFLVQQGTLRVGDFVVAGTVSGKIRAMFSDTAERIHKAGPSTPAEILGLTEIPQAGEKFEAVDSDKIMKEIMNDRKEKEKISKFDEMSATRVKREMLLAAEGATKELNIIIKTSTHGAAEAVTGSLHQLESKQIFVKVVHLAIGDITEADVMLASASNAIVIGFGVKEDQNAFRIAQEQGVSIRKYEIIYQMLEDIEKTMLGLLEPEYKEVETGTAEVRQIFTIGKTVKIAGCYVLEGKIARNKDAKVIRNGKDIFRGQISQLKRFKDDVKEVNSGYECGLSFDKFNDLQEGDIIKVLSKEEIIRNTLV